MHGLIPRNDMSPQKIYQTTSGKEYSPKNFRRIVEKPELNNSRDYLEYAASINNKESDVREKYLMNTSQDSGYSPVKGNFNKRSKSYYQS